MKYLLIIGKSGTGKTTLAKAIEKAKPSSFQRVVQYTTRDSREEEVNHVDYHFVTKDMFAVEAGEFDENMIAVVKKQFAPSWYGTSKESLDPKKWNILVASIEGVLDTLGKVKNYSDIAILNIVGAERTEAQRSGRDQESEGLYNEVVMSCLQRIPAFKKIHFINIHYNDLKDIRNSPKDILKFLKSKKIK